VDAIPREVLICQTEYGKEPFRDWLFSLVPNIRGIVLARVDRIEDGNLGDTRTVGGGVTELRIDHGPGYRVYFGQIGSEIHLIHGGTKATQDSDIAAAQNFWKHHA
jgi:putative addiction module killer protein